MTSGAFAHRLRSRNRRLHPIRKILRNHVARLGANSPSNKPLFKKKKKNANYLCLINIHDIRPHRYAPQSNPFLSSLSPLQFVRSSSLDLPASSFFQASAPLLATLLVDTAVRSVDEEGLRKFLNTESCWRCWHPPSSTYDAAKLNFLSSRLLGVRIPVAGKWRCYVPGIFRGFLMRRFFL